MALTDVTLDDKYTVRSGRGARTGDDPSDILPHTPKGRWGEVGQIEC